MSDIKVKFRRQAMEAETEVGSFSELIGLLQQEESNLLKLFGDDMETVLERIGSTAPAETATEAKPTRRKKNQPDPSTAVAPAPIDPPAADPLAIPAALDRSNPSSLVNQAAAAAASAPPPPPLMPAAPPIAPAAPTPPNSVLAQKFIDELQCRAAASADNGAGLVVWLQNCGIVKKDASVTFEESIAVVRTASDAQIAPAAGALGVTV